MDESILHSLLFGFGMATVGLVLYALAKSGLLTQIATGELWNSGQDNMQRNDVTY